MSFGMQFFGAMAVICLLAIVLEEPVKRYLQRIRARRMRRRARDILRERTLARRGFYADT